MRKNAKRGFTLVEVIVVLVVLALLAAIMIPAMTGWIDKAKQKRLIVACRTCVNAAQTLVVEQYGIDMSKAAPDAGEVKTLAGVNGTVSAISMFDGSAQVHMLTYTESAESVTYDADAHLTGEYYIFGAVSSLGNSDTMSTIKETLAPIGNQYFDSGAAGLSTWTDKAVTALAEKGIDLKAMNAVTWEYDKKNGMLYWTDFAVSGLAVGTKVPVIRYNFTTGTYTVWEAEVKSKTSTSDTTSTPYNYVGTDTIKGSSPIGEKDSGKQSYQQALTDYTAQKAKYGV